MPMTCTICPNPRRAEIDTALAMQGGRYRSIATQYSVSAPSLYRHMVNCLPGIREAVREVNANVEAKSVLQQMAELHQRTLALLTKAEASGDTGVALRAVREARGNLELLGRLDGSLDGPVAPQSGPVNVTIQYVDKQLNVHSGAPQLEGGD